MKRKIPATMATQHPDHSMTPYWHSEEFISTQYETQELFLDFSELGISEYKWDWEGKLVDEAVIERLYSEYYSYFKNNPLGKEKFLTFRLPNPNIENDFRLPRAFFTIWGAAALVKQVGIKDIPIFEAILPMTESAEDMVSVQEAYCEISSLKHKYFNPTMGSLDHIELIPLFEEAHTIMDSVNIIDRYLNLHKKKFGFTPDYMRPYIARSDPALNAGIVPTVLAIKVALSRYKKYSETHDIELFPMIGAAALPFRGGISPETVESFVNEYSGIKTTTIQSAFRYDYPKEKVIEAIKYLEENLQNSVAREVSEEDQKIIPEIMEIFSKFYKSTIENIADQINQVATFIPKRRERVQHIGLFGYSRGVGKVRLPRAITFTAALYSLGVPPELIGTGRGLGKIKGTEMQEVVERHFINLKFDLIRAGRFLNKENLKRLAKHNKAWEEVLEDIYQIEKYIGEELTPLESDEEEHYELSEFISKRIIAHDDPSDLIRRAARLRKSIG
ncbi:MAG TPA: phosphoenolpyruvate carboxylase [Candidatus Dojkabacteria bacterium]